MTDLRACRDCGAEIRAKHAVYCGDCRWRHRGKPARYVWTEGKVAYLRANYSTHERRCGDRIGALWGWPGWVIRNKAHQLGLALPREAMGFRPWTAEEVALLDKWAGRRPPVYMARQLKRSLCSVVVKLKRLGMSRTLDGYTGRAVALGFGVDDKTVTRWIDKGWLAARRYSADCKTWRISDDALVSFIRQHRTAYDLRKVDQVWFLDLALGASQRAECAA